VRSVGGAGAGEGAREVVVEEAVEKMLAGFAADGEAAGDVGAGGQATLDGIADGHIFILNFFADGDAVAVVQRGDIVDVGEIVVEDDGALVDAEREDEVGVHDTGIGVNHEVGIDPKIEGVVLAGGADGGIRGSGGVERAGLQAGALEILDGVLCVFDDAAEALVGVGNVITAVEVIVDVDLPVAIQRINAAIEVVKFFGEIEGRDERRNFAEKFSEWRGFAIEIDEDEIFPGVDADGDKAMVFAIKIADAFKFDHALEHTVVAVGPAMVGAAELLRAAGYAGFDGGGVMAADVVESAELAVIAASDEQRFFVDVDGEELAGILELIEAADDLPVAGENGFAFELRDAGIEIPGSGDGEGPLERIRRIIEVQNVAHSAFGHK